MENPKESGEKCDCIKQIKNLLVAFYCYFFVDDKMEDYNTAWRQTSDAMSYDTIQTYDSWIAAALFWQHGHDEFVACR